MVSCNSRKAPADEQPDCNISKTNFNQKAAGRFGNLNSLKEEPASKIIKPTFKRHIVLFLFCINSGNKSFQWIQVAATTKKLTYYYDVSNLVINSTAILFCISFIVLSLPACCLIKVLGVRKTILLGSFGTAIGSIIKCLALVNRVGVGALFAGLILVSISEQFIYSIPSKIVANWYPDDQVSTAMSICVMGNQLGVAIGFILPQYVLRDAESLEDIGRGLDLMFTGTAIISVLAALADWFIFDEAPKHAPGKARLKQLEDETERPIDRANKAGAWTETRKEMQQVLVRMAHLLRDRQMLLIVISYSISLSVMISVQTILDQLVQLVWPGDLELVGFSGVITVMAGAIGLPLIGQLLDRSHRYMAANRILQLGASVSLVAYAWFLCATQSRLAIYTSIGALGFFQVGIMAAGMELAVEHTYPAPEVVTATLMNVCPQIGSVALCYFGSYIVDTFGTLTVLVLFVVAQVISLVLLLGVKETLNRQTAVQKIAVLQEP